MRRLLLDTHALVWAVVTPDRLSRRSRRAILAADAEVVVSAASAWEVATKHRLGKLPHGAIFVDRWDDVVARLRATVAVIDADDARRAGAAAVEHRDPFDRLLAAQAERRDLTLVTADPAFAAFPIRTLW